MELAIYRVQSVKLGEQEEHEDFSTIDIIIETSEGDIKIVLFVDHE